MFLEIKMRGKDGAAMSFPIQYNYSVQGLIYKMLEPHLAAALHDSGYVFEKRKFKMFSFSRILGDFFIDKEKNQIIFPQEAYLYITSPIDQLIRQVSNTLIVESEFKIGDQAFVVNEIKVGHHVVNSTRVVVEAISPITIYSTLYKKDGSKFTYYYNPLDKDFSTLIKENLIKKYKAFHTKNLTDGYFKIIPIGKTKENIINYKGTIIKGYSGRFLLEGDQELIRLALETGIGGKNSQGFGAIRIVEEYL